MTYVESFDKFKQTQNVDADLLHVCVAVRCGDGHDLHTGPTIGFIQECANLDSVT